MKKALAILLALVMMLGLVACKGGIKPELEPESRVEESKQDVEPAPASKPDEDPADSEPEITELAAPEIYWLGSIVCQGVEIRVNNVPGATQYLIYKDGEYYKTIEAVEGEFTAMNDEFSNQEKDDKVMHSYSAQATNGTLTSEMSNVVEGSLYD